MEQTHKIFVNKTLEFGKIKFFGFDMDYTLAEYQSPALEILGLDFLVKRLVEIGYPEELLSLKYDPQFAIRGLWVDKILGNLLKTDYFGNILVAYHGFTKLSSEQIASQYPDKFVNLTDTRIMVANTHYNLPELFLIAATISHYHSIEGCEKFDTHCIIHQDTTIKYSTIVSDIRQAMDYVHGGVEMSQIILNDLDKYVKKSPKLPLMLKHLKSNGAKVFLLTNSNYEYTKSMLKYILDCSGNEWKSYFDYIVTFACKPRFFLKESPLKLVDENTNLTHIVEHVGPLESGKIYSEGHVEEFSKLIGAQGNNVLYFGDHIYGDVLKPKKTSGWKTCLIVPEIEQENQVWEKKEKLLSELEGLRSRLCYAYSVSDSPSVLVKIVEDRRELVQESIESLYGKFGSLFRYGHESTFFAEQVGRYSDIYTTSCLSLLEYSMRHMFRSTFSPISHEPESASSSD